jgi:septation ring formation regulator EzrA
MTGEEMERTMAFILEQQAQASASNAQTQSTMAEITSTMARLTDRLDRLTERTDRNAEGITALLAIAEMHEREITENRETQAEAQSRTDERLNALINAVERYIGEGRNGKT